MCYEGLDTQDLVELRTEERNRRRTPERVRVDHGIRVKRSRLVKSRC